MTAEFKARQQERLAPSHPARSGRRWAEAEADVTALIERLERAVENYEAVRRRLPGHCSCGHLLIVHGSMGCEGLNSDPVEQDSWRCDCRRALMLAAYTEEPG